MICISKFILWLWGWKVASGIPAGIDKAIIIAAPHTSNWDFVIGRLAYFTLGVKVKFLIKKEAFFWPFGAMIKAFGGIPVDRGGNNKMVDQIVAQFNKNESMYIVIAPEGTRSTTRRWKRGFYFIALKANVSVALGYLDYKKKEAGIGPAFIPCGDYEKDFIIIENFYKNKSGKYPDSFNLSGKA
jgi:1-acyl-sn-glycerol-3-phosphate acyltransferase